MQAVFFRWNILVICLTVVLKLAITVFSSLYFQTFWPKWLNFFQSFQKPSVYDWKMTEKTQIASSFVCLEQLFAVRLEINEDNIKGFPPISLQWSRDHIHHRGLPHIMTVSQQKCHQLLRTFIFQQNFSGNFCSDAGIMTTVSRYLPWVCSLNMQNIVWKNIETFSYHQKTFVFVPNCHLLLCVYNFFTLQ